MMHLQLAILMKKKAMVGKVRMAMPSLRISKSRMCSARNTSSCETQAMPYSLRLVPCWETPPLCRCSKWENQGRNWRISWASKSITSRRMQPRGRIWQQCFLRLPTCSSLLRPSKSTIMTFISALRTELKCRRKHLCKVVDTHPLLQTPMIKVRLYRTSSPWVAVWGRSGLWEVREKDPFPLSRLRIGRILLLCSLTQEWWHPGIMSGRVHSVLAWTRTVSIRVTRVISCLLRDP